LAIQVVQVSARLANSECAALPSVKDYQNLQREASARFAKKYPEFDVDFVKGTLSPKKK
jgi:hypothetical protein